MIENNDPLRPHSHDPNPDPPGVDPAFLLIVNGQTEHITVADLRRLPLETVDGCYIVSTGHGTSGPFAFGGTPLLSLLVHYTKYLLGDDSSVAVVSGDGFGTRLSMAELRQTTASPPLLTYMIDGRPLIRPEGLVRLIVPGEQDDALRQVKWVARIELL